MNRHFERRPYDSDDYSRYAGRDFIESSGSKHYLRSDGRIYEDVCEILLNDPYVDASNIEVFVQKGMVTLSGMVYDREMKKEAERAIEIVPGIIDIHNHLTLRQFIDSGSAGLIKSQSETP